MSDLDKYINKRKKDDLEFSQNFDSGYEEFKIGEMLKEARVQIGMTQEELALKLHTKSAPLHRSFRPIGRNSVFKTT